MYALYLHTSDYILVCVCVCVGLTEAQLMRHEETWYTTVRLLYLETWQMLLCRTQQVVVLTKSVLKISIGRMHKAKISFQMSHWLTTPVVLFLWFMHCYFIKSKYFTVNLISPYVFLAGRSQDNTHSPAM